MEQFKSKQDAWIVAVIWISNIVSLIAAIILFGAELSLFIRVSTLMVCGVLVLLVMTSLHFTYYTISGPTLFIRSGIFRWRVPISEIEGVFPTRSWMSGPAWSLDRLHIMYKSSKYGVLVSPAYKAGFLRALSEAASHLELSNDELILKNNKTDS